MAILTTNSTTHAAKPPAVAAPQRARMAEAVPVASSAQPKDTPPTPAAQAKAVATDLEQVRHAMDRLKQSIKPALANSLEFHIDDSTGKTVVKIVNLETRSVVRQIPSEEMLSIARALDRMEGRGGLVLQQA